MLLSSFRRYAWHTTDGPGRDPSDGVIRSRALAFGTTVAKDQFPPLPHINAYAVVAGFLGLLASFLTRRFFSRHL